VREKTKRRETGKLNVHGENLNLLVSTEKERRVKCYGGVGKQLTEKVNRKPRVCCHCTTGHDTDFMQKRGSNVNCGERVCVYSQRTNFHKQKQRRRKLA